MSSLDRGYPSSWNQDTTPDYAPAPGIAGQRGHAHTGHRPAPYPFAPQPAIMPDSDRSIAITFFAPERFARAPQVGVPIVQAWHSLLRWLTWPTFAADKRAAGAWCPCALEGGRVKGGTGPVPLLVGDVDECEAGAIDHSAAALASYEGAVIPTFSATAEKPKHRIVIRLDRALAPDEFGVAWEKFSSGLELGGIAIDRGCKNMNRLYFSCVARAPESWLGARLLPGKPLPVDRMLASARTEQAEARRLRDEARRSASAPPRDGARLTRYVEAAIDREIATVSSASPGARHGELVRAAYALARFDLREAEVARELVPAFVAAAGEGRRGEAERAVRDAFVARRSGGSR